MERNYVTATLCIRCLTVNTNGSRSKQQQVATVQLEQQPNAVVCQRFRVVWQLCEVVAVLYESYLTTDRYVIIMGAEITEWVT